MATRSLLPHRNLDAQTTGTLIRAGVGMVYSIIVSNLAASPRYLKLYDKVSAPSSADTPIYTIGIPAAYVGSIPLPLPLHFGAGIGYRASTGVADADNTAPTANDVVVNIGYA